MAGAENKVSNHQWSTDEYIAVANIIYRVREDIWRWIVNQHAKESAEKETMRAIAADEQANACYYQVLRSFISQKSTIPEAKLDSFGLKEIDVAWRKLNITNKNLRRAYMNLYSAYL